MSLVKTRDIFSSYRLPGLELEEFIAVTRAQGEVSDLRPPENAQSNYYSCVTNRPDFAVKIRKAIHRSSIHPEDEITGLKPRLFSRTSGGASRNKNSTVGFLGVDA